RPAYGCYPENRGKDNVGHSFHFFEALESSPALPQAHLDVLATDRTPDVPIRTSQVYLERLLERAAQDAGEERAALVDALLGEAWRDRAAWEPDIRLLDRIAVLGGKAESSSAAAYRMEVRLAVVLRLRGVLSEIAGRVYLATRATPAERAAYDALRACEDLRLPPAAGAPAAPPAVPFEPFPPWEDDVKLARAVLPAWMGINFRPASQKTRDTHHLAAGATSVLTVYPGSPAEAAGLQVGDVILGPPGKRFTEPRQVREWTMLSVVARPAPRLVQRGDRQVRGTLVPKPY